MVARQVSLHVCLSPDLKYVEMELSEPSRAQKNRCYAISSRVRLTTPAEDGLGMCSHKEFRLRAGIP